MSRFQTSGLRHLLFPAAACTFFLLAGAAFVPRLGIQNDEALWATALLAPRDEAYLVQIGPFHVPLMLMEYLGTLKSLLYRPMIRWFGTGVWATRFPMLLAGAAGIWLFYWLMRRIAGERAAIIGCGLLATDAIYLLTICFDWGPVALQHLLLIAGLFLLVKFWQERHDLSLAGGFFLFGLALWDKAIAAWMLSGMALAVLLLWPREIRAGMTRRRFQIAALALLLGASPLILYNIQTRGGTFRSTVNPDTGHFRQKLYMLRVTANASGLFGGLIYEDWRTVHPHAPRGVIQRASAALSSLSGRPSHGPLLWAFAVALLLAPLAPGPARRVILFAVLTMAVAWMQMVVLANAGSAEHHTILLWPFPQIVAGVSLAAASQRLRRAAVPVLTVAVAGLMISGLAVTNQYYFEMVRNGGVRDWSDAMLTLSSYLKDHPARRVFSLDWGILDSLRLLNRGRLIQARADDYLRPPELSAEDRSVVCSMISNSDDLFIAHMKGEENIAGISARLENFAKSEGYRRGLISIISDSYGRPVFEIFRFVPAP